jgi:hypothetical protein
VPGNVKIANGPGFTTKLVLTVGWVEQGLPAQQSPNSSTTGPAMIRKQYIELLEKIIIAQYV